ncbi:transposable element Tcb1 transposase [Trichonephila inaurata madagascariensis]|uniref:Transposable element Tcb1 transposase n=1 Tax=Trichonephila inaurata madagascariensis TaxID=2747483 RepID=A0A8X6YIQ8_9ARAC|nr:transposable element Tcb1 transposase [Trichonephila inaurata madagascariensis]
MRVNVLNKSRCGHPHKLSDRDARAIVRKVKKNPKISAPKLADQIATASEKKVHPETVRRFFRSGGYSAVSRKKPFISSVNQQKRLDFASAHVDKDFEFWKTVVFTDESKFNVFGTYVHHGDITDAPTSGISPYATLEVDTSNLLLRA